MNILVMKFGGTSVADPEKIQRAADRAVAARRRGRAVVAVVSAPGEMTDELLTLARRVSPLPDVRELDQLLATGEMVGITLFAMACRQRGAAAISLTGAQAGIRAAGEHGRARIAGVSPKRILRELRLGRIVAAAGFQGVDARGDVATLGRGGSDLTAVALAAALRTREVEIYSDVKGVYTADPRVVAQARKLGSISGREMLELAAAGAQVMQGRSIELAERRGVAIHVRCAFQPQNGTWIVPYQKSRHEHPRVSALALDREHAGLARISAVGVGLRRRADWAATLREALSARGIRVRRLEASDRRISAAVDIRHAEAALRAAHQAYGLERQGGRA